MSLAGDQGYNRMLRRLMHTTSSHSSRLAGMIDVALQLRDDESLPHRELRRRDRAVGRELAGLRDCPREQLLAWVDRVRPAGAGSAGRRVVRVHAVSSAALTLLGLVLGWAAAAAIFYYDGSHPVNVIRVLAVFVFAQLALLCLLAILLVPATISSHLPGFRGLQELLTLLSPGRLLRLAGRFLPPAYRDWLEEAAGRGQIHHHLFGRVQKWAMLRASQGFAVAFHVGALACCLGLVAFSDLAFSWNTTLQMEPVEFHRITHALATPWASLAPQADPSVELIRETRYYRLHEGVLPDWDAAHTEDPARLGGWWPFLAACLAFYGLLPRMLLWIAAHWRLRAAVDGALLHLPGAPVLLSRLNHQLVETVSPQPEPAAPRASGTEAAPSIPEAALGRPMAEVVWAGAPDDGLDTTPTHTRHQAGGARSIAQDESVIDALATLAGKPVIRIRVKAWEPPVAEFLDFLAALRNRLAPQQPILIEPMGPSPRQPPPDAHRRAWVRRIRGLGDPWITVSEPPAEGEPP